MLSRPIRRSKIPALMIIRANFKEGGAIMNTETIIHPKLQHIGLTTGRLQPMLDWYKTVLGMRLIYISENPTGNAHGSSLKAAWLSNDEANHRVAITRDTRPHR
jgi:hypothetical protein